MRLDGADESVGVAPVHFARHATKSANIPSHQSGTSRLRTALALLARRSSRRRRSGVRRSPRAAVRSSRPSGELPRVSRAWPERSAVQVRQHGVQLLPHESLRRVQVPGEHRGLRGKRAASPAPCRQPQLPRRRAPGKRITHPILSNWVPSGGGAPAPRTRRGPAARLRRQREVRADAALATAAVVDSLWV